MNPILAAKSGGALLVVAIIFGSGWTTCKWRYEAAQAAQLKAVADAYQSQVLAREASEAKLQRVTDQYDAIKDLPPVTAGLVERMRLVETATRCDQLPAAPTLAGRTQSTGGIPRSDPEGARLLQQALDAADRDSRHLNAVVKLAPPGS